VGVSRNHRFVVEVIGPIFKREEGDRRIGLTAISRFGDRHFSSINAVTVAEEHDDIAVEDTALGIEGQRRIGSKVSSVPLRRRQRQIYAAPTAAAVARVVSAHRQAKYFI